MRINSRREILCAIGVAAIIALALGDSPAWARGGGGGGGGGGGRGGHSAIGVQTLSRGHWVSGSGFGPGLGQHWVSRGHSGHFARRAAFGDFHGPRPAHAFGAFGRYHRHDFNGSGYWGGYYGGGGVYYGDAGYYGYPDDYAGPYYDAPYYDSYAYGRPNAYNAATAVPPDYYPALVYGPTYERYEGPTTVYQPAAAPAPTYYSSQHIIDLTSATRDRTAHKRCHCITVN
jgi:hypothetical protein